MADKRRRSRGAATPVAKPDEINLTRLKKENADLRRKLEDAKDGGRLIVEAIREAYNDPPVITLPSRPAPDRRNGRFHDNREIAVLHVSDVHVGKQTRSYNSDVAEERMEILVNKTVEITNTRRHWAKIDELHLYLGGDIIEGEMIFPHQAHLIDQNLFEQAVKRAPSILAKGIFMLAEEFSRIHICGVPGNHGRNGSRHSTASPSTNWDSVVYEVTRIMVNGTDKFPHGDLAKRITWDLPGDKGRYADWFTVDKVFDWGNMIIHGHEIRGGFAGYPWYGVGRRAAGWQDSIKTPWDYLYLGHFHTTAAAELQHRFMLANGRFDTDDQYALSNFGGGGCPSQRLAFYSEEHGLISDSHVFLDSRVPQALRLRA